MPVAGQRIVVVDDEELLCEFLVDLFKRERYEVHSTTRAREALQLIDEESCDLLITDIKMPEMDGLELLRRVHAARPDLPVVMMTGYGSADNAIQALNLGAFNFVRKPFAVDEILKVVRKGLELLRPLRLGRRLLPYLALDSKIRLPSRLDLVHPVSFQIVEIVALSASLRARGKLGVRLAVEELLNNAIVHGNRSDEGKFVDIEVHLDGHGLRISFTDEGKGFDATSLPDPTDPDNLFKEHGRGIFLARFYMDELVYNETGNSVVVRKSFDASG